MTELGYQLVVYEEIGVSGAKTSRPVLDSMMRSVRRRELKAVAVWRLDRLGRSLLHLLQLLQEFDQHNVRLLVHEDSMDTGTPQGRFFFQARGMFAEYERNLIAERVRDGMAYAKAHGTRSGRPIGRKPPDVDFVTNCDAVSRAVNGSEDTLTDIARRFAVSRGWIYKRVVPVVLGSTEGPLG